MSAKNTSFHVVYIEKGAKLRFFKNLRRVKVLLKSDARSARGVCTYMHAQNWAICSTYEAENLYDFCPR